MRDIGAPVYVVDDDASVREAVEGLVRSAGLSAKTFPSAQEFLASTPVEVPSCLVLDVELPGLSGLDLQQELAKADVPIPIIFLTGHGDIPMSVRAMKAGALEFLTKPIDDEVLLAAIRNGIAHYPLDVRSARSGPAGTGDPKPSVPSAQTGVFRKEGEYWTVGHCGESFRLKHTRGLGYLAHLLRHPSVEFHVLDLAGGMASQREEDETRQSVQGLPRGAEDLERAGIHITRLDDAGEMLDEQAKAAYRRRLSELGEELEEAKELGNVERAEQAEQEIDALTRELSRAVGLGGRNRRAASASERARQSITKSIKTVVERIAQNDAALGDIFSQCIKTGTFCSYQPDPNLPIAWEFGITSIEPAITSHQVAPPGPDQEQTRPNVLGIAPFSSMPRTPLVGRQDEYHVIRAAIDRARTGSGSLIMLAGGLGVGKTRLAIETAEYAARNGFVCFVGRCYERDEPFPYLPFVQIIEAMLAQTPSLEYFRRQLGENAPELAQLVPSLRRVFSDIPEPVELPSLQKRRYFFHSVAEALGRAARANPHLLILDDLHWADESTLALLTHLANRIAQLPLVIVGTYRDQYSEENPALARTLEELIRQGVRPLKLAGLSKDQVAQMLDALSRRQIPDSLVSVIFAESDGNPFFVEEVYRHLNEEKKIFDNSGRFRTDLRIDEIDVPENVRLIIARRLKRFSESETRALSAAAVIGRSFSFQLLTAITQMDIDELFTMIDEAQRMGIIVPSAEGPENPFTFAHELIRQSLLANVSIARRQQFHANVATAIERLYHATVNERAGEIADHLLKAGSFTDRDTLIKWLIQAGKAALQAAAFEEARAHFESALQRVGEKDSRLRAEVLHNMGLAHRSLGRWHDAHRHWEEALNIFIALDDRKGISRISFRLSQSAYWTGRWREAIEIAERALTRLSGVNQDRALLLAILGIGRTVKGDNHAAEEAFNAALALAKELSDNSLEGNILAFRSQFNFFSLRLGEAVEDSRRSVELAPASGPWVHAQRLFWRQAALYHLGHVQEAARIAEELEPLAARIGHVVASFLCRRFAAWVKFWKHPDLTQLDDDLRRDLDTNTYEGLDPFVSMLFEHLSMAEFFRGNWDQALQHAQAALRPGWPRRGAITVGMLLRLEAYAGDRDSALALLNNNREIFTGVGKANTYSSWALALLTIEGLFLLGEREQAAALYPLALEVIATGAVCMLFLSRFPQTAAGIAAAAARNWDAAEEHFRIALEQAESFPNRLEQAEIRRFRAMMLLDRTARGDRKRARELLSEALDAYTRIGMRRHVELTQALIAKSRVASSGI